MLIRKTGLVPGVILKRYQRFLADVELADGIVTTAHCTNTGTMASCWEPGDAVLLEDSRNPLRKLRYTWLACRRDGAWVGVDTGMPNRVVAEAARQDRRPRPTAANGLRRASAACGRSSRNRNTATSAAGSMSWPGMRTIPASTSRSRTPPCGRAPGAVFPMR